MQRMLGERKQRNRIDLMTYGIMHIIRKINMFLSHPVADLIRENTRFRSTCSFYDEQEYEEYVIGRHMRNHLGVKHLTSENIALCNYIYTH